MNSEDPRDQDRDQAPVRKFNPWNPPDRESQRAYLARVTLLMVQMGWGF